MQRFQLLFEAIDQWRGDEAPLVALMDEYDPLAAERAEHIDEDVRANELPACL